MRTIKFRGRRLDTGVWVCGGYSNHIFVDSREPKPCIHVAYGDLSCNGYYAVDPGTVGQYTGLKDRNGKEIYEGDIMTYGSDIKHLVEFKHGMFGYTLLDGWFVGYGGNSNFSFNPLDKSKEHEVIGNIFDNPELLKGGEQ